NRRARAPQAAPPVAGPPNTRRRRPQAEEVHQQREVLFAGQPRARQAVVELADDVVLRFAGTDTERTSHDLDEGTKRRERTVGPAAAGQDRHAALLQAAAELMQQSRLADAGLAYDVHAPRPS